MALAEKHARLLKRLRELGRVVVAYSGGVDSTCLLRAAVEALGPENALGVIARSPSLPSDDLELAHRIAGEHGLPVIEIETREIDDPSYAANPTDRCYFCKTELFTRLVPLARERGFPWVASGANADDLGDWRPGQRAAEENGVVHPLLEAGLTKIDIRELAREAGLENWDKPAAACLASRLPYGTEVTPERLAMIEQAERFLRTEIGLGQLRVRWHDGGARIECEPAEMPKVIARREEIAERLGAMGFRTVSLDLRGYRQGSLNEGVIQSRVAAK